MYKWSKISLFLEKQSDKGLFVFFLQQIVSGEEFLDLHFTSNYAIVFTNLNSIIFTQLSWNEKQIIFYIKTNKLVKTVKNGLN